MRDARLGVLGGDHLTLLGDAQRALHRARRLGQDRVVAGSPAAAHGTAATVEEPQPDSGLARRLDQVQLCPVQRPVRGQVAAVLVGVGVAEHDFLAVAAGGHHRAVQRKVQRRFENRRSTLQVVDGLEQRHDTDWRVRLASGGVQQAGLLEQDGRLEHVRHRLAHRDDVVGHRVRSEHPDRTRRRGHDVELLAGELGEFGSIPDQRPAGGQLGDQQLDPLGLGQRPVVGMHTGPRQQLGDHLLVHVGVLPQVQSGQVKTEDAHGFP